MGAWITPFLYCFSETQNCMSLDSVFLAVLTDYCGWMWIHTVTLRHFCLICSITGGGSKKDDAEKKKEDVLNIFSVASGHLYERFLRWVTSSSQLHSVTCLLWRLAFLLAQIFKLILHSVCLCQDNDAVCPSTYQNTRQVLVPQELPVTIVQGISPWLSVRISCVKDE